MPKEDRPRSSWRDIDKSREGSGGRREPTTPRPNREEERQQKQYRAALEALFENGGIGKLADKLGPQPSFARLPNIVGDQSNQAGGQTTSPALPLAQVAPAEGAASGSTPAVAPQTPAAAAAAKRKGEDKGSLRKKVLEGASRHEITKAVEKYLERYPWPDDHEFLEQLLEHEHDTRVDEAMARINQLLDQRHPPKRSRAMIGKLRYLSETSRNDDLREKADALLKRLQ